MRPFVCVVAYVISFLFLRALRAVWFVSTFSVMAWHGMAWHGTAWQRGADPGLKSRYGDVALDEATHPRTQGAFETEKVLPRNS